MKGQIKNRLFYLLYLILIVVVEVLVVVLLVVCYASESVTHPCRVWRGSVVRGPVPEGGVDGTGGEAGPVCVGVAVVADVTPPPDATSSSMSGSKSDTSIASILTVLSSSGSSPAMYSPGNNVNMVTVYKVVTSP